MLKNDKQGDGKTPTKLKSIFRSLFVPLFLIMILQAVIFYFAAVYGGIEESLSQNAADILTERMLNRKNELETAFTNNWSDLGECTAYLDELYNSYEERYGASPFQQNSEYQVQFLSDSTDKLIRTLRQNKVNGIYLILNDQTTMDAFDKNISEKKYGLGIRDMDQTSNYTDTEDLLLERSPSSIIEKTGCSLDSWWEAQYEFSSAEEGSYYYNPVHAAFENPGVSGDDLTYFAGPHRLSASSKDVISFSVPLISDDGFPYGVVGIELTEKYLTSLLPNTGDKRSDSSCYLLALKKASSTDCIPIVTSGALYNRCFSRDSVISTARQADTGGFTLTGRGNTQLYGTFAPLSIYNNNNPFEDTQLVLISLAESNTMFAYINHIKYVLMLVSLCSLMLGLICIFLVSRRFASPIRALAKRVRTMKPQAGFKLDRLGITEIDQLVDSIETLSQNVSRDIARTEFFSRMSHDMRTPMNAIISFSSPELLETADEALKDNYLEKIHSSGEYLLGLINEVLDMTKIESNKTELHYTSTRLGHTWDTIIPIIEKLAQKKNITFIKDIPSDSDICVLIDEQHLNQIILNLLSNAVKFTPPYGTVGLHVHFVPRPSNSAAINCHIMIQDNGIGISPEFMKNLYTPFEQENETLEGTGLGLSIARKLVELMGGSIKCDSVKDAGTTFTLIIPMQMSSGSASSITRHTDDAHTSGTDNIHTSDTDDVHASGTDDAHASGTNVLKGKHVLICEDHELNTQIICRLLHRKGMTTVTTKNGQEGLECFAASPVGTFDAVLMDIRMPVMDGLSAAKAMRSLDRSDALTVPIIAMTANAFAEDVRASASAGMNAHLSKPVDPAGLYQTLEELCVRPAQ